MKNLFSLDKNDRFMYYLASPFSSPDPAVEDKRYKQINKIGDKLFHQFGIHHIPPITISETVRRHSTSEDLGGSFDIYADVDYHFIERCDGVIVAMLPGWDVSIGVQAEIRYARKLGKPVLYLEPVVIEQLIGESLGE